MALRWDYTLEGLNELTLALLKEMQDSGLAVDRRQVHEFLVRAMWELSKNGFLREDQQERKA